MMKSKFVHIFAISLLALLLVGCPHQAAVRNTDSVPFANASDASLDQLSSVIRRAGTGLGWQMKAIAPGHILGTLLLRNHVAKVDITYNKKNFSINYKDSQNLDYKQEDGKNTIHSNYNGWIQRLEQGIMAQSSAL
ncbi:MAG: hypothetical protein ABW168_11575 [Sedimenticola sp.]